MILLSFAGCRKVDFEKPLSAAYQNEFSQLEVFKGKNPTEGALKQLKMRYGTPQNYLRYIKEFKPRHSYDEPSYAANSSDSNRNPRILSHPTYTWHNITLLDEYGDIIGTTIVRNDLYLLDQLEADGYDLPYSGRCGADATDAVRLISGMVDQNDQSYLSDNQINSGFVLLSVAYALSDCVIKINQEQYLYNDDWYEWSGSGSGGGGTGGYNNNLTTSTYKGVVYTPNDYPGKEANMPWMWWVNSNLNSQFYDLWEMMEEEGNEENEALQLDCYGTRRTGNINYSGTYEHWLIQLDYVTRFMGGVREYSIPHAGSTENRRGYVDLANIMTKEMFEIKPNSFAGQTAGENEITTYVSLANTHCAVVPPWKKGTYYPATTIRAGNRAIICSLHSPGVIVYGWNNSAPRPIPVASQEVIKKLKELLKLLMFAGESYNYILTTFLWNNPDVVVYIKSAAIGVATVIVVGTIIEDIMTAGVGIADDWLHFMMAYRLVRFAVAL